MQKPSKSSKSRKASFPITLKEGSCIAKVYRTIRKRNGKEYNDYTLVYRYAGKRFRKAYADPAVAIQSGRTALVAIANGQTDVLQLTKAEAESFVWAKEQLGLVGKSLYEATSEYLAAMKAMNGKGDLADAVRYYVANGIAALPSRTVSEVVAELLAAKKYDGCSIQHLRDLRLRTNKIVTAFPGQMANIRNPEIEAWLRSLAVAPRTRNNVAAILTSLWRFARRQGYLPLSSTVGENLARAKIKDSEVAIFTPAEIRLMLAKLAADRPDILPMCVLGAFAGLRTAEIQRLDWKDINLEQGHILVSGAKAKTGERRLVPIQPVLRSWLLPYSGFKGPVCPFQKNQHIMQKTVGKTTFADDETPIPGVIWKINGLRHSYGSYRLQRLKNTAELALEMGNSPRMIHKHYRELVTDAQAAEYWSIFPNTLSAQVIAMPSAS